MRRIYLILVIIFALLYGESSAQDHTTFYVEGRHLYDPCGEKVILRGIANPNIWFEKDGGIRYEEIEKTGANVIRIVWTTAGSANQLDAAIQNCIDLEMIPMVELHDATGDWGNLQTCVDYWIRDDIAEVMIFHEEYVLLNIANECGDGSITQTAFRTGYEAAILQIRDADIHVPLVIDGTDWGKNINILQAQGPYLIDADPDHNLIFSVHMWWPKMYGFTESSIVNEIKQSVDMGLPLIVGEFSQMHGSCSDNVITDQNSIKYLTILRQCHLNEVGWIAWSWFGNCNAFWDMSTDGTYDSLYSWGLEVAVTDSFSIQNTSVRSYFMTHGKCAPNRIRNSSVTQPSTFSLKQNYPNPFNRSTQIHYEVIDPAHVTLTIYDLFGNKIRTLINTQKPAGEYTICWTGENDAGDIVASGTYVYQITIDRNNELIQQARQMLLLK